MHYALYVKKLYCGLYDNDIFSRSDATNDSDLALYRYIDMVQVKLQVSSAATQTSVCHLKCETNNISEGDDDDDDDDDDVF